MCGSCCRWCRVSHLFFVRYQTLVALGDSVVTYRWSLNGGTHLETRCRGGVSPRERLALRWLWTCGFVSHAEPNKPNVLHLK
ncbi:unnamed protein product [Boreogadus saida]